MRRGRADRGAATVWTAFAACALCMLFGAVLALGQAVTARHRAGGAADLAALAAADRALWGESDACATATRVAGAQGAALTRCQVREDIADVTARVALGPWTTEVRSRAGPPDPRALPDQRGLPDQRAIPDPRGLQGQRAIPDPRGLPDPRAIPDPRGLQGQRALPDQRGLPGSSPG
ncbi:Rv3654c family TadE-like protein [Streptomyces sp. NPDC056069]|uniref:Rv3654c family TadE-like protein n=1 Tax=Streptomyces sp. NPDC056069 TaxID=3345702 RepID=UPI0035E07B15